MLNLLTSNKNIRQTRLFLFDVNGKTPFSVSKNNRSKLKHRIMDWIIIEQWFARMLYSRIEFHSLVLKLSSSHLTDDCPF